MFDAVLSGVVDSWAYPWTYTLWRRDWFSILPGVNLVQNIGFDGRGVHSKVSESWLSRPAVPIGGPMRHPTVIERDELADDWTEKTVFSGGAIRRSKRRIRSLLKRFLGRDRIGVAKV